MEPTFDSSRKTARLAGLLFFVVCFPGASWGLTYVPSKILVVRDAAATASNILANEFLFRTGILSHMLSNLAFVFMAFLLYRVFRPVDKHLSRIMMASVLAQVPIVFVLELFKVTALMTLKGGALMTLGMAQKQEFSYLLLRMSGYGIGTSQIFWGLFLLPFGMVVYRSCLIPRILAILFMINGICYVVDTSAFILLQRQDYLLLRPFLKFVFLVGWVPMLWFLIMGVRKSPFKSPQNLKQ